MYIPSISVFSEPHFSLIETLTLVMCLGFPHATNSEIPSNPFPVSTLPVFLTFRKKFPLYIQKPKWHRALSSEHFV